MGRITYEILSQALGANVRGPFAKVFASCRPCLEPDPVAARFILHRHRAGARKVRRILRREQQRNFAAFAAREGEKTRSLREFMQPRGWLRLTWRRDA